MPNDDLIELIEPWDNVIEEMVQCYQSREDMHTQAVYELEMAKAHEKKLNDK